MEKRKLQYGWTRETLPTIDATLLKGEKMAGGDKWERCGQRRQVASYNVLI